MSRTGSLSKRTRALLSVSAPLPVILVLALVFAPGVDGLDGFVFGVVGGIVVMTLSIVEAIVGLIAGKPTLIYDAALRLTLIATLATPPGWRIMALVPLGWKLAQTFDPAYACHNANCQDAIVRSESFGTLGGPQCFDELIRLADRRGGRAAAIRVLRKSWSGYSAANDEAYADDVSLLSLGRGFYHAVRCDSVD